jgi:hypothetical protein
LFLCAAHVVHLPKRKHEHQAKNTQFQPNSHDFPLLLGNVSLIIDSLDYQVILTLMPVILS